MQQLRFSVHRTPSLFQEPSFPARTARPRVLCPERTLRSPHPESLTAFPLHQPNAIPPTLASPMSVLSTMLLKDALPQAARGGRSESPFHRMNRPQINPWPAFGGCSGMQRGVCTVGDHHPLKKTIGKSVMLAPIWEDPTRNFPFRNTAIFRFVANKPRMMWRSFLKLTGARAEWESQKPYRGDPSLSPSWHPFRFCKPTFWP